ncbi:hypothetical protein J4450_00920 [Candidatus Micrarchaeota archaeon]|nr:hypothetical protein [Candidatus Micrarchaeota archaeon]
MLDKIWQSIKRNHFAQMAICCALPVVIILAMTLIGLNSPWLYSIALLVCLGSHLIMMYFNAKEGKTCH